METSANTVLVPSVGIVIIGRNEGERLVRCLASVKGYPLVYVDSGSSDESVMRATQSGGEVVELDMNLPFSAGRARNAGYQRLLEVYPTLSYIQFADGDCEIDANWIVTANQYLQDNMDVTAVCGRRRELFPERSLYNRLIDLEWDAPKGAVKSTGGDFMVRANAIQAVGGFNPIVVAGEEPELCYRLRLSGGKIVRLDKEMTRHDAALYRYSQWFKRAERCGHAYAQGAYLHGNSAEQFKRRETISAFLWGAAIPLIALLGIPFSGGWSMLLLIIYPVLWLKIFLSQLRSHKSSLNTLIPSSAFMVLDKFPQALGVGKFWWRILLRREMRIIEYKSAG